MKKKPVISSIGILCPIGDDISTVYNKIVKGEGVDLSSGSAVIADFNPKDYLNKNAKLVRFMSKETQFATIAVAKVMENINPVYREEDIAIYAGTGTTGIELNDIEKMLNTSVDPDGLFDIKKFGSEALYSLNPLISFQILPNMPVCVASINSKIKGNNQVYNPWEGNSAHAFIEAYYDLMLDNEKCIVTGGSDYKTSSGALISLKQYGLIPESSDIQVGKPFNPESNGFIPSEGAAYLLLEKADACPDPFAEILSVSSASDPDSILSYSKNSDLLADLINKTIRESGLHPGDIGLIISSADGNYQSDLVEKNALEKVFETIPELIAPKQFTGNMFAASPFVHIALGAFVLKNGLKEIKNVLITGFGIGSEKFCCILGKIEKE